MSQISNDVIDAESTVTDLRRDERYELLAAERRRLAVDVLSERDTPVALDDLAAAVAARETTESDPGADAVNRTAISLHHVHLPRLADAGVVEYDATDRRVDDAKRVSSIQPF